jgi:hypothetical protein
MGELRVLATEGDQKVIWDPSNDDQTEVAEMTFDKLKKKKYLAFSVDKKGDKKKEIKKFDPKAGAIIMTPPIAGG